jgi:hypothetical protein
MLRIHYVRLSNSNLHGTNLGQLYVLAVSYSLISKGIIFLKQINFSEMNRLISMIVMCLSMPMLPHAAILAVQ